LEASADHEPHRKHFSDDRVAHNPSKGCPSNRAALDLLYNVFEAPRKAADGSTATTVAEIDYRSEIRGKPSGHTRDAVGLRKAGN
jgi:hypothetical protein